MDVTGARVQTGVLVHMMRYTQCADALRPARNSSRALPLGA